MGRTNTKEEDSIMSRFSTRYYNRKFEIMEDGYMVAQFDTFEDMHQWIEETVEDCLRDAAFHSGEAEQAENFAESLTEMMKSPSLGSYSWKKFLASTDGQWCDV